MSGWSGNGGGDGHSSGSWSEHEPSEERGQAAWAAQEPVVPPAWASAQTQTFSSTPPRIPARPPALTPVPAPAPPPAPPSPPRARRLLLVLVAAAVFGSGVGAGVWFLIRDDSARTGAGATPLPSVVASTPTPTAPTPDSPSPSSVPGYRRAQDPVGYTLRIPEGWVRSQKQGEKAPVVYYDAPDDGRSLQIFALAEDTPAESLDLAENDPGYGYANQPGYRALDRASAAGWSELTYRYDDENAGPRQVIDHRFEAADGTLYAIRAAGPADLALDLVREPLTTALESFCPAGGQCR